MQGNSRGGEVGHPDDVPGPGGVEDDVQRVEETVVREDLVLLLEVVGTVEELDLGIELTGIGVQEDLHLLDGRVDVDGVDGPALNVPSLIGSEEVGPSSYHGRSGVRRGGVEGEKSPGPVLLMSMAAALHF